jgi:hypothetical protein
MLAAARAPGPSIFAGCTGVRASASCLRLCRQRRRQARQTAPQGRRGRRGSDSGPWDQTPDAQPLALWVAEIPPVNTKWLQPLSSAHRA